MPTEIEILKDVTLFQDLSSDELEILAHIIRRVKVQEGEMLTQRGMAATTLYVNLSGNAMVSYQEGRALTLHEKGDVVGVSVGVVPSVYRGTALALTDGEWLAISGQDLLDLVHNNNSLGEKILKKLSAISIAREFVSNGE